MAEDATRVAIVAISMILTTYWIARDKVPPSWDQSYYLSDTHGFENALHASGLSGMVHALFMTTTGRGPLFPALMLPLFLILHVGQKPGLLVNIAIWPVLLLSVDVVATRLFSRRAGLLAMAIAATTPILVGLSHEVLVDFVLCALTAATVALLLVSDLFRRPGVAVVLGLVLAMGILTKVTFPAFIGGPLLLVVGQTVLAAVKEWRSGQRRTAGLRGVNLAVASALGVGLAATWYIPNFSLAIGYIRGTTAPGPYGPKDPFALRNVSAFTLGMIDGHLSWVFFLAAVVAAGLLLARLARAPTSERRSGTRAAAYRAVFLLSWVGVPYLSVATSHDQDVRLMAASFVGFAVLLAGLIDAIPWGVARRAIAAVVVAGGVLQIGVVTLGVSIPLSVSVHTPVGVAFFNLNKGGEGYNFPTGGRDYATPALGYLESLARTPGGMRSLTVGVVPSDPEVNPNTFSFLAGAGGDPFSFDDESHAVGDAAMLQADFAAENAILTIDPPEPPGPANNPAGGVSPQLLALFPMVRTFPMGNGRVVSVRSKAPL